MSSPLINPGFTPVPPIPPLPPRRNRSMAGPFVLIVLGIVFLLGTMAFCRGPGCGTCSPITGLYC